MRQKLALIFWLQLALIFWLSGLVRAAPAPADESCDRYEMQIHQLAQELSRAPAEQQQWLARRIGYIQEIDRLEAVTRFHMCTDQDGEASLKFDTPEEELRDSIKRLASFIAQYGLVASKLSDWSGGGGAPEPDKVNEKVLGDLENLESKISEQRSKKLTLNGDLDTRVGPVYQALRQQRSETLASLHRMADQTLCYGLTPADLALAELYHETIPGNAECSALVKQHLLDRIRRVPTFGNGAILQADTWAQVQSLCQGRNEVTVPLLLGQKLGDAVAALDQLGLVVNAELGEPATQAADKGMVYRQNPESGRRVKRGQVVSLGVFAAPKSVGGGLWTGPPKHLCQDERIPVDARLKAYQRGFGGGHESWPVKRDTVCYRRSYTRIVGTTLSHYRCTDDAWIDCPLESTQTADRRESLGAGAYKLVFDGGEHWWTIAP